MASFYNIAVRGEILGQAMQFSQWATIGADNPSAFDIADLYTGYADMIDESGLLTNTSEQFEVHDIAVRRAGEGAVGHVYVPDGWPAPGAITTATDPAMPPFVAVSIRYTGQPFAVARHNWMRIPGLTESQTSNGLLSSAARTAWDIIMQELSISIGSGSSGVWTSCVYSPTYGVGGAISSRYVNPNVTTQNTRKYGRGS